MLSQLVTTSSFTKAEKFTEKLNQALTDLQSQNHEIIDVKFSQPFNAISALIIYK
ncbi:MULTISPECIES: hypothetical protein [Leuconostoc]|uniref:hypothetical protein n=1 Tax=Leuconostoc TaxID=1243 RepID=UPI0032DEE8DD